MRDDSEIQAASDRATAMWDTAANEGSKYSGMTYEDGLREAFDWVLENQEEDPTKPE